MISFIFASMILLTRTTSQNTDFLKLVSELDMELAIRNGDANDFFAQFNKLDLIHHVIIAYDDYKALGCGAIKAFDENAMEVKRMYVLPDYRGQGVATKILNSLLDWTKELGYDRCVLETGDDMHPALSLYQKNGFKQMPNYGQYADVKDSVCFEKYI
jgi:putative acetyltransferase